MTEDAIRQEYINKLKQLRLTFTPKQNKLFDEWYEIATILVSFSAIEYSVAGFQEGMATAKDLLQIEDDKET